MIAAVAPRAQTQSAGANAAVAGRVTDETGGVLSHVAVELRSSGGEVLWTHTDVLTGHLLNFRRTTREATVAAGANPQIDLILRLSVRADVVVSERRSSPTWSVRPKASLASPAPRPRAQLPLRRSKTGR